MKRTGHGLLSQHLLAVTDESHERPVRIGGVMMDIRT